MSIYRLVLAEIGFRRVNVALSLTAVAVAAALLVAGPALLSGYGKETRDRLAAKQQQTDARLAEMKEETDRQLADMKKKSDAELAQMDDKTRRIMRDLGVNLRIVHQDTNMENLYVDFVAHEFPEEYVYKLAEAESIETIVHLVATLQERVKWNGRTILVVGALPVMTTSQKNEEKPHMVRSIERGTVLVGSELARVFQQHELAAAAPFFGVQAGAERAIHFSEGDELVINGRTLKVAKVMPEYGGLQDVQLMMHLHDAQLVLGKRGQINQIMALNCKCKGDRISVIRKELEGVLPDTKVTEDSLKATAREQQRDLVSAARAQEQRIAAEGAEKRRAQESQRAERELGELKGDRERTEQALLALFWTASPLAVLAAAVIIGLLTWLNVRERRQEIGVLLALGKGGGEIAGLFLGKAFAIGLAGGLAGCLLGLVAVVIATGTMLLPLPEISLLAGLSAAALVGAPLIAALAAWLPTLAALRQDPSVVLMDA